MFSVSVVQQFIYDSSLQESVHLKKMKKKRNSFDFKIVKSISLMKDFRVLNEITITIIIILIIISSDNKYNQLETLYHVL